MERRPLATRNKVWAQKLASVLARSGVSPNMISVSSVVFAMVTAIFFYQASLKSENNRMLELILAAVFIQLRLLANLFDGMVAVEHHKKTKLGDLYNDIPDRISDSLVLIGTLFLIQDLPYGVHVAWLAALLSIGTAYLRALGASLGDGHLFLGPMAKPHRMALLTATCVISAFGFNIFYPVLLLMTLGLLITCCRRVFHITKFLQERA